LIQLESLAHGVVLPVRAQAGARNNGIQGEHDGALKVSVTQAPEKGKANKAIVKVLAKQLGLRKSHISLISGETSSQKRFSIDSVSVEELRRRIEACFVPRSRA
jgi:uncharacterized protein (TIGR00251 family)